MKLVLYGGGVEEDNAEIDAMALRLTGKKKPRIAYIPSCSYESEIDFGNFVKHFNKFFGLTQFIHFPIDIPFDRVLLNEVLNSDLIHLSGGNTYYFLKHLKRSGMLSRLREYVLKGGVLTGLSAGGIVMTPTITTASFPSFDCDENDENLKNLNSMGLVKFEFFPHYSNSKRYDQELLSYSKKLERPIYASTDTSGIIVEEESIKFFGRNYCFFRGRKFPLNQRPRF